MIRSVRQLVTCRSTLPESMLREGGSPEARFPIVFSFFLLETDARRILVDTSCDTMPDMELLDRRSPADALLAEGVSPDAITDVLLTHAHHDHIEGVHYFPRARFYIQEDEYASGGKAYFPSGADVTCFRQSVTLDDVRMTCIGGHSIGSSVALFRFRDAPYLIAGDECYAYENIRRRIPPANPYCLRNSQRFFDTYVTGEWRILLSHQLSNELPAAKESSNESGSCR